MLHTISPQITHGPFSSAWRVDAIAPPAAEMTKHGGRNKAFLRVFGSCPCSKETGHVVSVGVSSRKGVPQPGPEETFSHIPSSTKNLKEFDLVRFREPVVLGMSSRNSVG